MDENKEKISTKKNINKKVTIIGLVSVIVIVSACTVGYYFFGEKVENNDVKEVSNNYEQEVTNTVNIVNETNNEIEANLINKETNINNTNVDNKNTNLVNALDNKNTNLVNSVDNTTTVIEPNEDVNNTNKNSNQSIDNANTKPNNPVNNKNTESDSSKDNVEKIPNNSSKNENVSNSTQVNKPILNGTDTQRELTKTETKYGVKINTYTTTMYSIYSDGSRVVESTTTDIEYDKSNYKASTSELLAEAKSLKSSNSSLINGVLGYVNQYRKEANEKGVNKITNRKNLKLNSDLTVAACARAIEMAYGDKFSHTRPNGSSCFTILDEMGISYMMCGENVAYGQTSAKSVSTAWKNSQGHYENMIEEGFTKIGIGVIKLDGTYYWVQLFT